MGAPGSGMKAAEQPAAETLLSAFKTIGAAERRRHASVLNYWLSIRGDKEFPPLHDLDPLEISDAGPNSALLELISGGHDAEIRHLGEALRDGDWPERVIDADNPSILACIAKKLPIVAISRDFLAFEDEFSTPDGKTRCWVTLLPLSAGGAWVDYVYAFVSFESAGGKPAKAPKKPVEEEAEVVEEATADVEEPAEIDAPDEAEIEEPVVAVENEPEEPAETPPKASAAKGAPGFSKLLEGLGLGGFYAQGVKVEPVMPADLKADEPVVEEVVEEEPALDESQAEEISELKPAVEEPPVEDVAEEQPVFEQPPTEEIAEVRPKQPTSASEGTLQTKLTDVRAKADEARMAKLRANVALYEGLGAAYDFALDAEEAPEEYLKLVEAQGLKIQLRSPMKPVVKLAFDGLCDDSTIKQLEAVLAWALAEELPRGSLAERIEAAGGIGRY